MNRILNIIILLYFLNFLIKCFQINYIKKVLNKRKNITRLKEKNCYNKELIILIPVLREEKIIEETLIKFKNEFSKQKIVVITTDKEKKESTASINKTKEKVEEFIKKSKGNNIYICNYPYEKGYMAEQLNYCITNLEKVIGEKVDNKNTYVSIYNADSEPEIGTCNEIIKQINKGKLVIQQYSYAYRNFEKLNWILKGFAIYQSEFEIKSGIVNGVINNIFLYRHVVGHGLTINLKLLKKIRLFNTKFWCEDIYLSMLLKGYGIEITPLLKLERMETPQEIRILIKQNAVWYDTTKKFIYIYKDIIQNFKDINKKKLLLGMLQELNCTIKWLFYPIFIFIVNILLLYTKDYILLVTFIFIYTLDVINRVDYTTDIINLLGTRKIRKKFENIIQLAIAILFSNIGPLYNIFVRKKVKYKTER